MLKNKKFGVYMVLFCILSVILMFMYSGLMNGHYSIVSSFSGWTDAQVRAARTAAEFVCIALAFVYGTLFMRLGVRRTLIPCIMLCALGCVGFVAADGLAVNMPQWQEILHGAASADPPEAYSLYIADNGLTGSIRGLFWLFSLSSFVTRCGCLCIQMAGFQLAVNWFIKHRGRILGIITMGSPLFSGVFLGLMTKLIASRWNYDYRMFYAGFAVALAAVAVLVRFLMRDMPEEVGLYPDGADRAPVSEDQEEENRLTVRQVLSEKRAWLLIGAYGAFRFVLICCMSTVELRFRSLGGPEVWSGAAAWLTVGAVLGVILSYVFGWLDDRLGTARATLILGGCEVIPVLTLMFMPAGGSVWMEILWGFGVACMIGGVPTMHPASVAFAYGRREYQSANRVILAIQLIPSAFAAMLMTALIRSGRSVLAYGICLVVVVIGLAAAVLLRRIPDAMAGDRNFVKNC